MRVCAGHIVLGMSAVGDEADKAVTGKAAKGSGGQAEAGKKADHNKTDHVAAARASRASRHSCSGRLFRWSQVALPVAHGVAAHLHADGEVAGPLGPIPRVPFTGDHVFPSAAMAISVVLLSSSQAVY